MSTVRANSFSDSVTDWIVKRGILYVLTQMPMVALMIGYFFRWTSYPTATVFTVILGFTLLPVWIILRRQRSTDPTEPVHHFHIYALFALFPYVVYNLARIPMHYLLNIVFWDHWYDFGSELTGAPVDQWASLIPGTFLHSLQGFVLSLGFYILYRRHSLINALIYVWIFLSVIYTWTFPTYVLVDYQPPAKWFFVVWWAHLWMALATWYIPRLYVSQYWGRFRSRMARLAASLMLVGLYFLPVTFVFWRVHTWQFAYQREIDETNFQRVQLVLHEAPTLVAVDAEPDALAVREARYQFTLRFGPRSYKDYINATKAMDAASIQVSGRLLHQDEVIAWCYAYVEALESPNTILRPADYFPALQRLEFTDIPVQCAGPANAGERILEDGGTQVTIRWLAQVKLIGDREQRDWEYQAEQQEMTIAISDQLQSVLAAADE